MQNNKVIATPTDSWTFSIQALLAVLQDPAQKQSWEESLHALFVQIRSIGLSKNTSQNNRDKINQEWISSWESNVKEVIEASTVDAATKLINDMKAKNIVSLSGIPVAAIQGKTFIVRVDWNDIHSDPKEETIDDIRLNAAYETLKHIVSHGGRLVLITHSGRSSGTGYEKNFDIEHIRDAASRLMNMEVTLCRGEEISSGKYSIVTDELKRKITSMGIGKIIMLDNARFDWREQSASLSERAALAHELSELGDYYVLDGFPISHRHNATVVDILQTGIPCVLGYWMDRELAIHEQISQYLDSPTRGTLAAIFGGGKADKIPLVKAFARRLRSGDKILIGGLLAKIIKNQHSDWLQALYPLGINVILAVDDVKGYDIGLETVNLFKHELTGIEAVYWNGPLGRFEEPPYSNGSDEIAKHLKAKVGEGNMIVVISGGETAPCFKVALNLNEAERQSLQDNRIIVGGISLPTVIVSTGGGTTTDFFGARGNLVQRTLLGISPYAFPD